MSTKETGGSAFPVQESSELNNGDRAQYAEPGMTLRDYFAAKAISGWLSSPDCATPPNNEQLDLWCDNQAKQAYRVADAMIKAREQ
jgi:hypothetical protein